MHVVYRAVFIFRDNEETFKMETDTQEEEKADTTDDEN